MKPTYYKVVAIERKNKKVIRRSFLHKRLKGGLPASVVVKYQLGKPTSPQVKGTKLMVFGSKAQALQFQAGDSLLQVWECDVTNPKEVYHVSRFEEMRWLDPTLLQELWRDIVKHDEAGNDWYSFLYKMEKDESAPPTLYKDRYYLSRIFGSAPASTFACDTVTLTKRVK